MVIIGSLNDHPVTISVKTNCLTVSFEGLGEAQVFSYDFEGRLWTALVKSVSYRRGLDGKMVAKWTTGPEGRERRWLSPTEADQILSGAREKVTALYEAIQSGKAGLERPLPEQACQSFTNAIGFESQRSQEDVAQYHRVYKPVGILPPDQYMAVVLQLTEGCAFNTCTFCNFYRDRPFRIKSPDEFQQHCEAVRLFLGGGLSLRRTIFLGDANALVTPMKKLLPLLEIVHQAYDVHRLGGIYAFLDGFSGEKKSPEDYRRLADLGMQRIYIGLESGNDSLLSFIKKPGKAADVVQAVRAMKAGGVAVGVIVLLGAGGKAYEKAHVRDTIRVLNAMHLDLNDILYFSELIASEGMQYVQDAFQAHLEPLSPEECQAQGEAIENGLKFTRAGGVPHISRYDIREFVY